MKKQIKYLFISFLFLNFFQPINSFTQQGNLDSLWQIWNDESKEDTIRLKAMHDIAWDGYLFSQPDSAFYFAQMQHDFAVETKQDLFRANAINTQGVSFYVKGNFDKALIYYRKSLKIQTKINDKNGIANSYNNIGSIYWNKGDPQKTIEYYFKCLKIREEIGVKIDIATALNYLGVVYENQDKLDSALIYYNKGLKVREEVGNESMVAKSYNNIGNVYYSQGEFTKAIELYSKCLEVYKNIGNKTGIAFSMGNIGNIYFTQGNQARAIEFYTKALKINEELNNEKGIAMSYINIGAIYSGQGDYKRAIDFGERALKIRREIGDKKGLLYGYNSVGLMYSNIGNNSKALEYFSKSLEVSEGIKFVSGIATSLNHIGDVYFDKKNYSKALEYYLQSLTISKEVKDKMGEIIYLNSIGNVYYYQGKYSKSITSSSKALDYALKVGIVAQIKDAANSLYKSYKKIGKHALALENYELFITMRDSIKSEANQKEVIRQEYKYTYEKQAAADSIKAAEEQKVTDALLLAEKAEGDRQKIEIASQKKQQWFLFGGLTLVVLFALFIFNRLKITRKQKAVIETQKQEVEEQKEVVELAHEQLGEKNKEIMDSISYAKRIQSAILPPQKLVKQYLEQSFILYKPKDIVAGDFYWMESVAPTGNKKETTVLFAAADCTGHGVPGAMVSVICNNGLNRSVREYGLTDPGEILTKTREIVISEFEKSEEEVKDGMDIALVSLSVSRSLKSIPTSRRDGAERAGSSSSKLQYSGAHNPLWIIRKGATEIEEIKADKQPIGTFIDPKPYTTHTVELNQGDTIYIFSDGYVDQFGGEKGKKFKAKAFRALLLSIQDKSMEEQQAILDESFEKWRGTLEQIDDVCVIGVKI